LQAKHFIPGITPTAKQKEAYENDKKSDPIYQRLLKDAGYPTSAPTAAPLNYDPKTRTFG
jgi:hypothetical protein